jgi:hypothetical protein
MNRGAGLPQETDRIMSEPTKNAPKENVAPLVDKEGLKELLAGVIAAASTVAQHQNADQLKTIVEALQESRKPYVNPAAAETERQIRANDEAMEKRKQANIKRSQDICTHMQGSNKLSEIPGALTAIAKHRIDTGIIMGICLVCSREFWPEHPDYGEWMNRKSGCRMSEAGRRF